MSRQALHQDGKDEDQADEGGDRARDAADQGAEPEGSRPSTVRVQAGADDRPDHSRGADAGFEVFRRQYGLPGENAANEEVIPAAAATPPKTAALAASMAPRCGAASKVNRIDPAVYSLVMTTTPGRPDGRLGEEETVQL
jgi:hypothetical protein